MILIWLLLIPLFGGLLSWLANRWSALAARWVALLAVVVMFLLTIALWVGSMHSTHPGGKWFVELSLPWIPQIFSRFHLALDGLSLLLIALTGFLGILSIAASWRGIEVHVGFFHFNLLLILSAITGVFLAEDLFLFYLFWELMLVPLFFLIDIWGHERRHYAALKFFIFTQTGGLFLLLGILALVFLHGAATGHYTFDYVQLLGTPLSAPVAFWVMLSFFLAFAVKLPSVPLHTWLPDAHTQAPVAGSVDLAGLVLKVGAYGMLRFVVPLFPAAALAFAPVAMGLGVISIFYGALLAFGQHDLKRLVAYTSISHMGFALLGIFAWNTIALQGVMIVLLAHGISTGALFILVGIMSQRLNSRSMEQMGGLWARWPLMGGFWLFFALATLGLPGLANFVGEFLVLLGVYRVSPIFALLGALGFIVSIIYSLWMVQRVFYGPLHEKAPGNDLTPRENAMLLASAAISIWIGVYPQTVLNLSAPSMANLLATTGAVTMPHPPAPNIVSLLRSTSPPSPLPSGEGEVGFVVSSTRFIDSDLLTPPSLEGRGLGGEVVSTTHVPDPDQLAPPSLPGKEPGGEVGDHASH